MRENENDIWGTLMNCVLNTNVQFNKLLFVSGFAAATSTANTSADFTKTTVFPFQPTTLKATSRGLIMRFKGRVYKQ